jgi:Uma2 family endonuclease
MSAPVSTKKRTPNLDVEDGIEYPSSDGKPMGETGTHARVAMWTIFGALYLYFLRDPKVAVHGNLFVYYVKGDPKRCICPDAFVAFGAENNPDRRSYKVWKEGKAPDVIFEVTSKKTRKQDLGIKFEIYRDVLKVQEYFLFDPFEEYLDPSLQGYRLVAGQYEPIPSVPGGLASEVLGFGLQRRGEELRFYNPQTGKLVPLAPDLERELEDQRLARREAEVTLREEGIARRELELENERLRREIEDMRRQTERQG